MGRPGPGVGHGGGIRVTESLTRNPQLGRCRPGGLGLAQHSEAAARRAAGGRRGGTGIYGYAAFQVPHDHDPRA
jgi:hypothetical protein